MLRISSIKTSQQKAMPLPIPYPQTDDSDNHREDYGAREINRKMRQETADDQKSLFPDIEFKGSGQEGMAVRIGKGIIGKYTDDEIEAKNALKAKATNIPCVATIYDVQHIQKETGDVGEGEYGIWMIIMEEIEHMSLEDAEYISALRDMYYYNGQNPGDSSLSVEYAELRECLKANKIPAHDAHGSNVGRNKEGRLVLFDLG